MIKEERALKIKKLQENLKDFRQLAGLTAQQLADEIDVTKQTIHRLEAKEKPTKTDMTYCQYRTIRLVFDGIVEKNIKKDPNDTNLKNAITLLVDKADELSEEQYSKTQDATKIVTASKKAGVTGLLLKSALSVVGVVLSAVIMELLSDDD